MVNSWNFTRKGFCLTCKLRAKISSALGSRVKVQCPASTMERKPAELLSTRSQQRSSDLVQISIDVSDMWKIVTMKRKKRKTLIHQCALQPRLLPFLKNFSLPDVGSPSLTRRPNQEDLVVVLLKGLTTLPITSNETRPRSGKRMQKISR